MPIRATYPTLLLISFVAQVKFARSVQIQSTPGDLRQEEDRQYEQQALYWDKFFSNDEVTRIARIIHDRKNYFCKNGKKQIILFSPFLWRCVEDANFPVYFVLFSVISRRLTLRHIFFMSCTMWHLHCQEQKTRQQINLLFFFSSFTSLFDIVIIPSSLLCRL